MEGRKRKRGKRSGKKGQPKGMTREEAAREFKRKKLLSEAGIGDLNSERYRKLWREAKLYTELPGIRTKIEVGWQTFERALATKDFRIAFLLNALTEAETQSRRKEVARSAAFERTIQYHETRMRSMKMNFRHSLEDHLLDRHVQCEEIGSLRRDADERMRKIYLYLDHQREDARSNIRSTGISKISAFIEDAQNARRDEMARFEQRLMSHCNQLQDFLAEHQKGVDLRRTVYDALEDKDKKQRSVISRQYIEISTLLSQVENMRRRLMSLEYDVKNQIDQVGDECMFLQTLHRERLNNFIRCKRLGKSRSRLMSTKYEALWQYLKDLVTRAERILGLIAVCRKYETQEEKVLFPEHPIVIQEPSVTVVQPLFKNFEVLYDIHGTATLWHRLAIARATASELNTKKNELTSRVSSLRQAIALRWEPSMLERVN